MKRRRYVAVCVADTHADCMSGALAIAKIPTRVINTGQVRMTVRKNIEAGRWEAAWEWEVK